jgi:hypothetical protein
MSSTSLRAWSRRVGRLIPERPHRRRLRDEHELVRVVLPASLSCAIATMRLTIAGRPTGTWMATRHGPPSRFSTTGATIAPSSSAMASVSRIWRAITDSRRRSRHAASEISPRTTRIGENIVRITVAAVSMFGVLLLVC